MLNLPDLKKIYYNFLRIRTCQLEIMDRYHPDDNMKCPIHFCTGQELMPSILSLFLAKKDTIYSHHRSHGYFLANGGSMKEMISEFHGKSTGTNGGLAGSQELSCTKSKFYSGTILSGALAMSVGDAYSKKYKNEKSVSVSVIGNGGMEEGIVFESINLAAVMKLPTLFICENNLYSTHTSVKETSTSKFVSKKIKPYGIKTYFIENQSVEKVYQIIKKSFEYIRKEQKPVFIEIMTYRFNGHVGPEGDDHFNYRSKLELSKWKKNDPMFEMEKLLTRKKTNIKSLKNNLLKKINNEIDASFKYALKSPFPKRSFNFNLNATYSKVVKKFYDNKVSFKTYQEGHKPKPY